MASPFSNLIEDVRISARALLDFGDNLFNPTVRLGVTGLSRAGKTVFITALVHGLTRGGRFPVFDALAGGRIAEARLTPQPDDAIPRFAYEQHLRTIAIREWPQSTSDISELRLVIDYQSASGAERTLTLDIVDYPGEWLLDLPLLEKSFEAWSAESMALARAFPRDTLSTAFRAHLETVSPSAPQDEQNALTGAALYTDYLRACRDARFAMSLLPPGRFLLPGSLANSPALTFHPLDVTGEQAPAGSHWAMMKRRYEAYKDLVVRPFFRDHFARLDRQIVLVDALAAFNAGPEALRDLQAALGGILDCFHVGRSSLWSTLFRPRIDRILFAATKADHLHQSSHDRLEAILRRMVMQAADNAAREGAKVDVVALSAIRATREAQVQRGNDILPSIIGVPAAGEAAGGVSFNGVSEVATFPGDLPVDADALFADDATFRGLTRADDDTDYRFLRFRPPVLAAAIDAPLPHIRLDRALQFLIGDRLR